MSYTELFGIRLEAHDGRLRAVLPFTPDIVGRPEPPRLHGGIIAGLLETVALATAREAAAGEVRILSTSVDYLRGGKPVDSYAEAQVVKAGRHVVNIVATAWQKDRGQPIARAHINVMIMRDWFTLPSSQPALG